MGNHKTKVSKITKARKTKNLTLEFGTFYKYLI